MIWDTITIMNRVKTGTDELGNNTYKMQAGKTLRARKNAPKDEPVSLDDRDVTKNEHLFYLPKNQSVPPDIEYVKYKNQIYKVLSVEAITPRFVQVRAVHYEGRNYRGQRA